MAQTEFYCDYSAGNNLNGGSPIGGSYPFTYASGSWVAGTGVFTVASGNPLSDGVQVGDFASVYPDGTTPDALFIGRVTARTSTTITVDLVAKSGTAPVDGTSNRTVKVGGPWKGPNATSGFPFTFAAATMTNAVADTLRINFRNNASYQFTAAISASISGPLTYQGYSSSPGDGGKAILDVGTSAIVPLSANGPGTVYIDLIVATSATTGTNNLISIAPGSSVVIMNRVVAHGARGSGFSMANRAWLLECEAYDCGRGNNAAGFSIATSTGIILKRCYSHNNAGTSCDGFLSSNAPMVMDGCIADNNTRAGLYFTSGSANLAIVTACDFYNNTVDGINLASTAAGIYLIENCNLFKNGGYGINGSGSGSRLGSIRNCCYGAGAGYVNGSGDSTGLKSLEEIGKLILTSQFPWVDPANGDYRINAATCKNAGRGSFTETGSGKAGTIGYPDIGAAQHLDAGGGLLTHPGLAGGLRG